MSARLFNGQLAHVKNGHTKHGPFQIIQTSRNRSSKTVGRPSQLI